jgi:hypothetical protein
VNTPAKLATLGSVLAAAAVVQRVSARTGATTAEAADPRPGDDIILEPTTIWNRGTTIAARPSEIWPWLVQMGFGRGGFYVPEWVDRLVWRVPAANSGVLLPQYAHIAVGDVIADGPQYLAYWRVEVVEPERALVFWTRRHPWRGAPVDPRDPSTLVERERELLEGGIYAECSWGFYLDEIGGGCTRLLIRTRAVSSQFWLRLLPYGLIDAYLSHAELRTIKRLVEAAQNSPASASAQPDPLPPALEQPAPTTTRRSGSAGPGTREEAVR